MSSLNCSITEFKFEITLSAEMPFVEIAISMDEFRTITLRNKKGYECVEQACVCLYLCLTQKYKKTHDKNVLKIIVNMIWETRGTKIWIK